MNCGSFNELPLPLALDEDEAFSTPFLFGGVCCVLFESVVVGGEETLRYPLGSVVRGIGLSLYRDTRDYTMAFKLEEDKSCLQGEDC
jgi:hypothetical protein